MRHFSGEYCYDYYNDFEELERYDGDVAEEMKDMAIDEQQEVRVYYSLEDFALYEYFDGWYSVMTQFAEPKSKLLRGAPNPADFIDFEALGQALSQTWDESCHFLLENGEVVETN